MNIVSTYLVLVILNVLTNCFPGYFVIVMFQQTSSILCTFFLILLCGANEAV